MDDSLVANVKPKEDDAPKRRDFLEYSCDHMKAEYAELLDAWKQIDTKAQGATAIAGIFLAASFAYAKAPSTALLPTEKLGLGFVVLCLVAAITLSAWVMLVRLTYALTGRTVAAMASDAIKISATSGSDAVDAYDGLLADTIDALGAVNRHLLNAVNRKAGRLRLAHFAILLAAVGIVCLTVRALAVVS